MNSLVYIYTSVEYLIIYLKKTKKIRGSLSEIEKSVKRRRSSTGVSLTDQSDGKPSSSGLLIKRVARLERAMQISDPDLVCFVEFLICILVCFK
jgi:hypothetical protein